MIHILEHEKVGLVCGHLDIQVDELVNGIWRTRRIAVPNLVTDVGKNEIRNLLLGSGIPPAAIGIGTSSTAPAVGDVQLGLEVFRNVITRRVSASKKATFQLLLTIDEANGNTLTEAGLFNSSVVGNTDLYARAVYSPIQKNNTIQVTYTWDWDIL